MADKHKILIVEDDISLNQGLCRALKSENRQIISCMNLKSTREQLLCGSVSLVLLDINLPDGNGLDFLSELKITDPLCPVILLTANDTDMDIVTGLEQGADDYITKPFKPSVLYAKCQAILNRSKKTEKEDKETIWLDESKHLMYVDGEAVALPNKEYLLMELFLNNKNQLFTRSQILNKVWGYDYYGDGRAVDTYIKKLRKKLGVHSHRIQTIMKAGYTYTDEED